jgi:hypothetical protein
LRKTRRFAPLVVNPGRQYQHKRKCSGEVRTMGARGHTHKKGGEKKAHAFQEEKEKSAWKIRLTKGEKGCRIQLITSKSK